jgi:CheY-like chemotaxis protein
MEGKMTGEPFHILLVEDDQDHADLVIRSLKDNRVANTIHHVMDGEKALDYLRNLGKFTDLAENPRPLLILLDLRLPRIDGLEVLKEIKSDSKLQAIPVVRVTTSKAELDVAKAYEYNANSYLVKPVDFKRFQDMMNDLGFYWLGWNQLPWTGNPN